MTVKLFYRRTIKNLIDAQEYFKYLMEIYTPDDIKIIRKLDNLYCDLDILIESLKELKEI